MHGIICLSGLVLAAAGGSSLYFGMNLVGVERGLVLALGGCIVLSGGLVVLAIGLALRHVDTLAGRVLAGQAAIQALALQSAHRAAAREAAEPARTGATPAVVPAPGSWAVHAAGPLQDSAGFDPAAPAPDFLRQHDAGLPLAAVKLRAPDVQPAPRADELVMSILAETAAAAAAPASAARGTPVTEPAAPAVAVPASTAPAKSAAVWPAPVVTAPAALPIAAPVAFPAAADAHAVAAARARLTEAREAAVPIAPGPEFVHAALPDVGVLPAAHISGDGHVPLAPEPALLPDEVPLAAPNLPLAAPGPPLAAPGPPLAAPGPPPPIKEQHLPPAAPLRTADIAPLPPVSEPTVVGRYNAGGAAYVMYSDGSIEAETDNGTFRFGSMDELRDFIEIRNSGSTPAGA